MAGEAKTHHYVPQCLLRNFASNARQSKVWVYDKHTRRSYESGINNVAAENHYNTISVDGQGINLEPAFSPLDGRLADLIRRLLETPDLCQFTAHDRVELALLTAVQILRVRLQRDSLSQLPGQLRAALGFAGVDELVAPDFDENAVKQISLGMMQEAEQYVPALMSKHWMLLRPVPGCQFWISDNPVVIANEFCNGGGLASQGAQIRWPISKELCLSFSCPSIAAKAEFESKDVAELLRAEPILVCPPNYVAAYNLQQVAHSTRFVFSAQDDFGDAERLLDEYPETRHVETKFSPSPAGTRRGGIR